MIATLAVAALLAALGDDPTPAPLPPNCTAATGFTGTICTPPGAGRHPVLVLLGGWEGGDAMAALAPAFASAGYLTASVAYFGTSGVQAALQNVPVETVGTAIGLLSQRPDADPKRVGVCGFSKGGELALLAAATDSRIHAVVADVASPFAYEGIPTGAVTHASSWTVAGKPVPYVPFTDAMMQISTVAFKTHTPIRTRPAYDDAASDAAAVARATFPLEKIAGPVLFLSAGDDRFWNSTAQSAEGLAYLRGHRHAFADGVHGYPLAGHNFLLATAARPLVSLPFIAGLTLDFGGTPKANLDAAADAMTRIDSFLAAALP